MLYVSGWLMVKQDPRGWQDYLAHKADNALAQDTVWAVGALAFLAVFREGAENRTVHQRARHYRGRLERRLFAGLGAATLGSFGAVLFHQPDRAEDPAAAAVIITSAFLFAMAIKFIGEAVQEFQEQSMLPFTELKGAAWLDIID